MDFTLKTYRQLLLAFQGAGYKFLTFEYYCISKANNKELPEKFILLRHDVDLKAENSLATAKIEAQLGIVASYYFRVVPQSNKPNIIKAIAELGHEIGYHYEDMGLYNGNESFAIEHFEKQLKYFRQYYPVKTICMHGNPTSKWDSKDLWKTHRYQDFGIIGEPYFDIDFSSFFYLTDTGRCWNGYNMSIRDKIPVYQDEWIKQGLIFHSTYNILDALKNADFHAKGTNQMMITTHPQRWTDSKMEWIVEFFMQNLKNIVKYAISLVKN